MYPESLNNLIETLKYLKGVGEKTAERYAFDIMDLPDEKLDFLLQSIQDVRSKIHECPICHYLTEDEICCICSNKTRNSEILCVVEDVRVVKSFEQIGIYSGNYHILKGLISPLDGVNPEDIGLDQLIRRIQGGNFKEIILAFKPGIEGQTTALYIKKILGDLNITISRIASGIPMGADLEYMDAMTLERALFDRVNLE